MPAPVEERDPLKNEAAALAGQIFDLMDSTAGFKASISAVRELSPRAVLLAEQALRERKANFILQKTVNFNYPRTKVTPEIVEKLRRDLEKLQSRDASHNSESNPSLEEHIRNIRNLSPKAANLLELSL